MLKLQRERLWRTRSTPLPDKTSRNLIRSQTHTTSKPSSKPHSRGQTASHATLLVQPQLADLQQNYEACIAKLSKPASEMPKTLLCSPLLQLRGFQGSKQHPTVVFFRCQIFFFAEGPTDNATNNINNMEAAATRMPRTQSKLTNREQSGEAAWSPTGYTCSGIMVRSTLGGRHIFKPLKRLQNSVRALRKQLTTSHLTLRSTPPRSI